MSAGGFSRAKYEADYAAAVHPIRVQPETLAFTIDGTANASPAGEITNDISARSSAGKRTLGLIARQVAFVFTGTLPDGYKAGESLRLPILNKALFAKCNKGATGTYLSQAVEIVSKSAEIVN